MDWSGDEKEANVQQERNSEQTFNEFWFFYVNNEDAGNQCQLCFCGLLAW